MSATKFNKPVDDEIKTLNDQIGTSKANITVTDSQGDFNGVCKSGNCVTLTLGTSSPPISSGSVATVPSGYRPTEMRYIRFGGIALKGSSWVPVAVGIYSTGVVFVFYPDSSTYTNLRISLTYMI